MNDKTIIKGKIRIVSPVHIGGAQEKHALKGLDYVVNKGTVYFLDENKLIAHFGIDKYSNALALGKLEELCGSINLTEYSKKVISDISGEIGTDIKINIKNSLSNKPIIPGSSLKGALRSVFVNKLGGAKIEYDWNNRPKTVEPFGSIAEDINRFMIVADTEFNQCSFVNTKTFNLRFGQPDFKGGWKHELRGGTNDQFHSSGFTFPHEVIAQNDFGDLHLVFNTKSLQNTKNTRDPKILKINNQIESIYYGSQQQVFEIIQNYSAKFIEKELAFFRKFEANQSGEIITFYGNLLIENKKMPIIRLGLGSGFHSMTGDPYDSHDIDAIDRRGKYNGKDSAKSRKIAFRGSGDDLRLMPLGFIQLITDEYYDEYFKEKHEEKLKRIEQAEKSKKIAETQKQEEIKKANENRIKVEAEAIEMAKIKAEEALQPKMVEISILKKAKWVDAVVVGQNGKMLKFKPFISGFEEKVFEISYSAGMPLDTVIQVMCMSPNGKCYNSKGLRK
ncbi:MAG: hypothetical protein IPI53_01105 [Saprospiraceae bacterium]|nr:hypothetical protein [Saprospiraceae bacterium]